MVENTKDKFDKLDVYSRIIGTILIPAIVAFSVMYWNSERTKQQTTVTMSQVAVGILSGKPTPETEPLRRWAISVLQTPSSPPVLSDDAALALQSTKLDAASSLPRNFTWQTPPSASYEILSDTELLGEYRKLLNLTDNPNCRTCQIFYSDDLAAAVSELAARGLEVTE